MSEKGLDRRRRYTQMVIKGAFIELLGERPIAKITVKEICARADVNRATFYAHFQDSYDLLRQIEDGFVEDVTLYLAASDFGTLEGEQALASATKICEYVKANEPLCRVLFGPNGDARFLEKAKEIIRTNFIDEWFRGSSASGRELELILCFAIGGAIEVIQRWIENDLPEEPQEIAALVLKMASSGASAYR
ncbi:MAG: TetR/AcrR family transcriptional regulator [Clostridiales Family XIII bacterium]|jgi:AcrR family transcriptional regulator|nr:TetR/AcrR family transcriptional regulator [Clostridiales Family XIII bacterium]